jgi:hypothetical protein
MESQESSGVNTVLIVLVLVIVVGFVVWMFAGNSPANAPELPNDDTKTLNVDVDLPGGQPAPPTGGTAPTPAPTN